MEVVLDQKEAVGQFVAAGIQGCERGFINYAAIGVSDGDTLVAGLVYHNWSPEAGVIEMSVYATARNWCPPHILKTIFGYPFDTLGCRMVVMRVAEGNRTMRSIAKRLGSREYVIDDLRAEGEAEVVCTLKKAAWLQFLGVPNG